MAMLSDKEKLMMKLQSASFAMKELFLDTHPTCREGIEYFKKHKDLCNKLKAEYAEKYGPITTDQQTSDKKWSWVTSPFPWERSID